MKLANCEKKQKKTKWFLLLSSRSRGSLQAWVCVTQRLRDKLCARLIGLVPALTLSVPQESAVSPELYFDVLVEVLTYLDKGLSLGGCPVAGMDKHEGGIFGIQAPVSEGTTQHSRRENKTQTCISCKINSMFACANPMSSTKLPFPDDVELLNN